MAIVQASDRKSLQLAPTTTITGNAPGLRVLIVVTTREVKTRELIGSRFQEGNFPEITTIVQNITLTVNGKDMFVPRLAFMDLYWVYEAELALTRNSAALIIHGGDGMESFKVRIEFDKARVKRRALFSPVRSAKPAEQTLYYEPALNEFR
jgi:hypothetical protein